MSNTRGPDIFEVCEALAAEIRALRAENAQLRNNLVQSSEDMGRICAENESLRQDWEDREADVLRLGVVVIAEDAERENARLRDLLSECAEDLAAELKARYEIGGRVHMQRQYDRDMDPVVRARAALSGKEE